MRLKPPDCDSQLRLAVFRSFIWRSASQFQTTYLKSHSGYTRLDASGVALALVLGSMSCSELRRAIVPDIQSRGLDTDLGMLEVNV